MAAASSSLLILHPRLTLFATTLRPLSLFTHHFSSTTPHHPNATGRSISLSSPPSDYAQKIDVNPPKGTRDFPPEDMRLRNWLFHNFREVSELFGFEEVDYPVLETESLYIRKAGEEIRDQLYCFEDKGNRRVALRPELTPSLARLVIQKGWGTFHLRASFGMCSVVIYLIFCDFGVSGKSVPLPIKWFAIGQCWRYERMTRGRRREHYQWNMDIIGVPDVTVSCCYFTFSVRVCYCSIYLVSCLVYF
ncbi:putative histidine--tRNA ligase [Helianthus debilis subsp. tardiflorus]